MDAIDSAEALSQLAQPAALSRPKRKSTEATEDLIRASLKQQDSLRFRAQEEADTQRAISASLSEQGGASSVSPAEGAYRRSVGRAPIGKNGVKMRWDAEGGRWAESESLGPMGWAPPTQRSKFASPAADSTQCADSKDLRENTGKTWDPALGEWVYHAHVLEDQHQAVAEELVPAASVSVEAEPAHHPEPPPEECLTPMGFSPSEHARGPDPPRKHAAAHPQPTPAPDVKRRRASEPVKSVEEVRRLAAEEGLPLIIASNSAGFKNVSRVTTAKSSTAPVFALKVNKKHLGCYGTAEQAALAYSRLIGHEAARAEAAAAERAVERIQSVNADVTSVRAEAAADDDAAAATTPVPRTTEGLEPKQKRVHGPPRRVPTLSAAEVERIAAAEGLTLQRSNNASGFLHVSCHKVDGSYNGRFMAHATRGNVSRDHTGGKHTSLGTFGTAEHAALAVARHLAALPTPTPPTPKVPSRAEALAAAESKAAQRVRALKTELETAEAELAAIRQERASAVAAERQAAAAISATMEPATSAGAENGVAAEMQMDMQIEGVD